MDEKIVAVLHDVLEDTNITIEDLRNMGVPEKLLEALNCLTKRDNEKYIDFINRVATNEIAKRVKINDIKDNIDLSRIVNPTKIDLQRVEKYKQALKLLLDS